VTSNLEPFPGTFPGTIKAPLDVRYLTENADVVCAGEVVCVEDRGVRQYLVHGQPADFHQMVAVFHIDRIYKGRVPAAVIELPFLQSDIPSGLERLQRGEYLLLFVKRQGGQYGFVHPTTSKMPIARPPVPSVSGQGSPLARVRRVLTQAVHDPDPDVAAAAAEQLAALRNRERS
jgi:hypothetical protein